MLLQITEPQKNTKAEQYDPCNPTSNNLYVLLPRHGEDAAHAGREAALGDPAPARGDLAPAQRPARFRRSQGHPRDGDPRPRRRALRGSARELPHGARVRPRLERPHLGPRRQALHARRHVAPGEGGPARPRPQPLARQQPRGRRARHDPRARLQHLGHAAHRDAQQRPPGAPRPRDRARRAAIARQRRRPLLQRLDARGGAPRIPAPARARQPPPRRRRPLAQRRPARHHHAPGAHVGDARRREGASPGKENRQLERRQAGRPRAHPLRRPHRLPVTPRRRSGPRRADVRGAGRRRLGVHRRPARQAPWPAPLSRAAHARPEGAPPRFAQTPDALRRVMRT